MIEGLVFRLGKTLGHFHGFGSQSPGRIVDDPPQPQGIGPVVDDAQIGQHILDFRPVKKACAADDPIRDAISLHGVFQRVGLGIGPVENGKILHSPATGCREDLTCHIIGFRTFVRGFVNRNWAAGTVGSPKLFALTPDIMRNHRVGGVQNRLGGTVILFQTDGSAAAILLFKAQDILDGGAPEPINTLIIIADHADILIASG